ncbi:hypothetical protein KOW79_006001 [Hemibagrus wyckioides]|uniref:Uncharacterized protein n=1 Tax=Hemibagrus wyckioides TaxID=337641 RepID=A0A9D3SS38_9TELE|nr:hypothetical protein KOW79_006001 [Hemibagrus wyckioides]
MCKMCPQQLRLREQRAGVNGSPCPSRKGTYASLFAEEFLSLSAWQKGEQEEALLAEGAAEPVAPSGPVSEEAAGPSNKEVQPMQAEGGSSDLTLGESLPSLVQPDWASMEFSDGMENEGSDPEQDVGEGGRFSGSGCTREAEGVMEERRIQRSPLERGWQFDLLTAENIAGTREIEAEGAQGARVVDALREDCLEQDEGTREEKG